MVDTYEGRDVSIFDIVGVYFYADMHNDKDVRLKLEGEIVDIMWNVNPDHIPNIRYKNGKKVIYLRVLKALYGWTG